MGSFGKCSEIFAALSDQIVASGASRYNYDSTHEQMILSLFMFGYDKRILLIGRWSGDRNLGQEGGGKTCYFAKDVSFLSGFCSRVRKDV